jgi:hypothetical protein
MDKMQGIDASLQLLKSLFTGKNRRVNLNINTKDVIMKNEQTTNLSKKVHKEYLLRWIVDNNGAPNNVLWVAPLE